MGHTEAQQVAGHEGREPAHPVHHHLGNSPQGQLQIHGAGLGHGQIGGRAEGRLEPIRIGCGNHLGAHTGLAQLLGELALKSRESGRHHHLQAGVVMLQCGGSRNDVGQHVAQFLAAGCRHQQKHRLPFVQPEQAPSRAPVRGLSHGVQQGMAHIGDLRATTAVVAGLLLKDGEDLVGEADQVGAPLRAELERPLLGSDVIRDRHLGIAALEIQAQVHIGPHVVDQHHPIGHLLVKPAPQAALQSQGGQEERQGFPETNRAHAHGVGQQAGTGALHALPAQGHDLQGQPAPPSLPLESRHQQGSLQVA